VCAGRTGGFDECDDEVLLSLGDHAGSVLQNTTPPRPAARGVRGHGAAADGGHPGQGPVPARALRGRRGLRRRGLAQARVDDREREQLAFASLLHDVGKIGISERILLKPGRLTPEERSVIELHPRIGHRLVEQVPGMEEIAPVVLHHHERWDGEGYPARLRGEDIPLGARLVGVADAFSR
jgi:hypothetical protein